MRVIGTAGHVDHGKSTLVQRLTNINPDRLIEEQKRSMTIDLGFAWFELPNNEMVGIVDVPGHRDFIENMLAGVGGIDAVVLVIAADEGVMPQTREHLAILDLLGVKSGLVALTKTDLIDDPDWLELVIQEIEETLAETSLRDVCVMPVSAHSGAGIPELIDQLTHLLDDLPPHIDYHQPRLAVDRVFTISGFGTVVTGTLLGGNLHVGDEIELQPTGLRGRIRSLQSYKQNVQTALPGSRVAVNITGVEKSAVLRGHVLTYPGQLRATLLADVYYHHLPDASRPLKHNTEVKLFVGAAETTARARLLDTETLPPGASGWLQLRLENPLALAQGDRYILRYPSPPETIGGGTIINPHPGRRWKRFQNRVIDALELRMAGTPAERLAQAADQPEPLSRQALQQQIGYSHAEMDSALSEALAQNLILELMPGSYLAAARYHLLVHNLLDLLQRFHQAEPLRRGMQREHLRNQLGIKPATFNAVLEQQPDVVSQGNLLHLPDHEVVFSPDQQAAIQRLEQVMKASPYSPPSASEIAAIVSEDVLGALLDQGDLVRVQPDVIFTRAAYDTMLAALRQHIQQHGAITAAELRDRFNTTRKYAIGLLEHLDRQGVTRRQGDARILGPNA